jgi:hypothetical protein
MAQKKKSSAKHHASVGTRGVVTWKATRIWDAIDFHSLSALNLPVNSRSEDADSCLSLKVQICLLLSDIWLHSQTGATPDGRPIPHRPSDEEGEI